MTRHASHSSTPKVTVTPFQRGRWRPPGAQQLACLDTIGKRTKGGQLYHPYKVAKVKGPASCSRKKKREVLGKDRISQLPDDTIVAILSLLTLQEAGRTSVLSHRWRYLWTFVTGRLNFDAWKTFVDTGSGVKICSSTYASWVDKVLELHQGPFIDEFIIRFSLERSYSRHIDSWIDFAFKKGVKRFELDLANTGYIPEHSCYNFPSVGKFWLISNTVQGVLSNGHVTRAVGCAGFCSLTSLRLRYVNVTGEVLEHFLGNCPLLEQLQVIDSKRLQNLKVVGPSLKLKCLEISNCWRLKILEISAINLVALTYDGAPTNMLLKNIPVLSEFCAGGSYCTSLIYKSHRHLNYLLQLEVLKLNMSIEVVDASRRFPRTFPELCHLKRLEVEIIVKLGKSLIIYTSLIKACPSLSKFAMRYTWDDPDESSSSEEDCDAVRSDARAAAQCKHPCLKVVELVGFEGNAGDLELASHLLDVAVSLDELVIKPLSPFSVDDHLLELVGSELLDRRRNRAWQLLETKLPPNVSLVVL